MGFLVLFVMGCAGANGAAESAPRVPFSVLSQEKHSRVMLERLTRGEAVVIAFEKGQVVPVRYAVDSRLFEVKNGTFDVVVLRDFQLLLWDGPPRISEDGVDFETSAKNAFRLGFAARKGEKPYVDLGLAIRRAPGE
jgi:hypothetical protein